MYEKILIPLDGSGFAEVALPYAEEMAGRLGSEVTLIYFSESSKDRYYRMYQSYIKEMANIIERGAEKYLKKSEKKLIKVNSKILIGSPAEAIVRYADKENIGLIVMAARGRSGITRWALGSVVDKVIRATKQPLALIRAKGARPDVREKGIMKKALVPLDGSKESEAAIPYIEELASKLQAEVVLLQVLAPDYHIIGLEKLEQLEAARASAKDYIAKMEAYLKQKGITAKSEFREITGGTAADEIINLADEMDVDLVAMSTHGRSGISRWALGSVADKVLRGGNTPLLLIRTPGAITE